MKYSHFRKIKSNLVEIQILCNIGKEYKSLPPCSNLFIASKPLAPHYYLDGSGKSLRLPPAIIFNKVRSYKPLDFSVLYFSFIPVG